MNAYYNEFDPYAAEWLRNLINRGLIADGEVDGRSIVDVRADDLRSFTQCHFFAGIGVWSHALRLAGWPDDRPVWTGSCPCQPFSVAGKRLGADDPRHLWPDVARIVRECEPEWCFFENVRGHVRLGLREVRSELQGMGYRVHAGLFSAEEVGASHQRERLFILADRSGERGRWLSIRQGESVGSARHAGGSGPEMADPDGGGFRGPRWGHHAAGESDFGRDGEALGDPNDAGRSRRCELHGGDELPAFAPGPEDLRWRAILDVRPGLAPALAQSELRRVVDGLGRGMDLSRAFRLRLTGNGVVPLVAAYAFRTLAAEAGLI